MKYSDEPLPGTRLANKLQEQVGAFARVVQSNEGARMFLALLLMFSSCNVDRLLGQVVSTELHVTKGFTRYKQPGNKTAESHIEQLQGAMQKASSDVGSSSTKV